MYEGCAATSLLINFDMFAQTCPTQAFHYFFTKDIGVNISEHICWDYLRIFNEVSPTTIKKEKKLNAVRK